jgi:uncharacterized damage-inducible protein DinB
MAIRDGLLAEFDHEVAVTRRVLRSVPDDRLSWKPHERSRSIGQLAAHMIEIAGWTPHILDVPLFDLELAPMPAPEPVSMTSLLARFDEDVVRARGLLDRTDGELAVVWSLVRGGTELFSMPRSAAFRTFVVAHLVHHRGQLSVYLRLNDIAVPPIYGPTADSEPVRAL